MPLGMEFGLGSGDFVFDGEPAISRKKGTPTPTQFLVHVYCGQMAGWMSTPLRTEVDLGTGHIVLDVVPPVRKRGIAAPPLLSPMSVVATVAHLPSQLLLSSCSTTERSNRNGNNCGA